LLRNLTEKLGHLNRNKNESNLLPLPPCPIHGVFFAFLAVGSVLTTSKKRDKKPRDPYIVPITDK